MYKYYNANTYNNDVMDCSVRAISTVEDTSWDYTYNKLSDLARKEGLMFDSVEFIEEYLDNRYPRQCHYSKTVGEFIDEHPKGRYLITMQGHITCVIDGVCYDTFDPTDRIMRCAWKVPRKNKN